MTVLVLGGAALVFALVLAYSYSYSRRIILIESEQSARNLTLAVANRIEQEFRAVSKVAQELVSVLETSSYDRSTLLKLIQDLVRRNKEIFGSTVAFEPYAFDEAVKGFAPYYYKAKGGLGYEQLASNYDYSLRDWYHIPKVLKEPIWTQPYFDEGGGYILMTTYSCPVFQRKKAGGPTKVRAIVTADISLEWLTKLVSSLKVGRTGYGFIVSDTGTFVTHPRKELIMVESVFSLAEEHGEPRLRKIGRAMIGEQSGFVDLGSTFGKEEAYLAYARIPSPGWSLGAVFPKNELFAEVTRLHKRTVLLAVVGVALLLLVSLLIARSIAGPVNVIARATARVAEGDLEVDLSHIRSKDEVGQLARAFTDMTAGLKERDRIRRTFGRYLTHEVVTRLLETKDGLKLGGEAREITMIMSDLRGFTALVSGMPPAEVIAFLNRYLGEMFEILIDHKGIIDEIIGDGILAFFGAPEPVEDHPALAVACALKMQAAMERINALNEADGLPLLEMGVAVNTGEVIVGNIGSEKRSKYGAVGSQVNFTGRIESFTVGGQVLISRSTYERVVDLIDVRDVLEVEMKGVPGKVRLYDAQGIRGPYQVSLDHSQDAPVELEEKINVRVYRMDSKILTGTELTAALTQVSLTTGVMVFDGEILQWEDVRMVLLDDQLEPLTAEVYAKVVSVEKLDDGYQAMIRFTSVSPDAYRMFRQVTGAS